MKTILLTFCLAACAPQGTPTLDADVGADASALCDAGAQPQPDTPEMPRADFLGPIVTAGDSILFGAQFADAGNQIGASGAWRWPLFNLALADGIHLQFVGTRDEGPPEMPERDADGVPGAVVGNFDQDMGDLSGGRAQVCGMLLPLLLTFHPSLMMVAAGTNDVDMRTWDTAARRLASCIGNVLFADPKVRIVVIVPPLLGGDPYRVASIASLRASYLKTFAALDPRVLMIDAGGVLTLADLYPDKTHPTPKGDAKMAGVIWPALKLWWFGS